MTYAFFLRSRYARYAALALLGLTACSPSAPPPQMALAKVTVLTLKAKPYAQSTSLPGRLTAYLSANVTPQVTGVIQKRLFDEGTEVHPGQLLYQLDPGTYQAAYDQAKANLANAQAALYAARPQAERAKQLVKIDAVSKQDFDTAIATLKQDEATVQADQAAVESARVNLGYTRITAPIGGTIATSTYTVGALVTANQSTALTTIYRYDPVYVDITQSSAQYLQLRKDLASGRLKADASGAAKFKLLLEDGSTYQSEGSLHVVGVAVDESTGTITLRGTVANPDKMLLPNMYVHADLEQGVDNHALWVPQQGVSHDAKGDATALVVGADNKVVQKNLTVAGAVAGDWIVDSGLKAGDRVIIAGVQNVKEGDTVDPQEAATTTTTATAPISVGQSATPKS